MNEIGDEPEILQTGELRQVGKVSERQLREERERTEFEESNFVRTTVKKRDR